MSEEKNENFTVVPFPESKEKDQLLRFRNSLKVVIVDDADENEKPSRVSSKLAYHE